MSRIGKLPITIPEDVTVTTDESGLVTVKGPKGTISQKIPPQITISQENSILRVIRHSDEKIHKSYHGLARTLVNNMVVGVTKGFEKNLTIDGTGFRAENKGARVVFSLGYSHQIVFAPPKGVTVIVRGSNIKVSGIDKQLVGEVAAKVRSFRVSDPYKGKGIRYKDEIIHLKAGKTGA